jgi:uncharacterized protein
MKTLNQKSLFITGFAALTMLVSCSKEEAALDVAETKEAIEPLSASNHAECGFVDGNWPSSATLATSLQTSVGTAAESTYLNNQNVAIKTFWRGSSVAAPTFRFVRNGTNYNSTFNAISYGNGRIYFGEGIYRAAKAKDASNIVNVMILAHEYGHQLQFTFGLPSVAERTARAGELEADGMAGYYIRRGLGKNTFASIATSYEFAASIGDNSVTSPNHHGTAAQRRSAVRLGFLLADPTNAKLNATSFDDNFFFYYNGVLDGTYRLAKPEGISEASHNYIMSKMTELKRIADGRMSDNEYLNLQ